MTTATAKKTQNLTNHAVEQTEEQAGILQRRMESLRAVEQQGVVEAQRQARTGYRDARDALHRQLSHVYGRYEMGLVPFSTDPQYTALDWIEGPIVLMEKYWRQTVLS